MILISVDLPAPLSPTQGGDLPGGDVEVDVVERVDGAEVLGDAAQLEQQRAGRGSARRARLRTGRAHGPPKRTVHPLRCDSLVDVESVVI